MEVRVGPRVLGSLKVNSPGGFGSFKSSFSQRFLIPTSLNRPLPAVENCFGTVAFSFYYFKYAIKLSSDFTDDSAKDAARLVMSCAATCRGLLYYDLSMHPAPQWGLYS